MKRIFFLLALPFSLLGEVTCTNCVQTFATVKSFAIVVTNDLHAAQSQINYLDSNLNIISGEADSIINYATSNGGSYDSAINGLASGIKTNLANCKSSLGSISSRVDSALYSAELQLLELDNFSCSCGGGSCSCSEYLHDINLHLESISSSLGPSVSTYLMLISSTLTYANNTLTEIKSRLTVPDDDYKSDLASLFSQLNQAIAQGNDLLDNSTAANINQFTFNKTVDYMSNADLALAYLYTTEYQNMIINRRSSRRLDDILSVISNLSINVTNNSENSNQWSVDLAFISNYLYNIQRSYFELFNTRNTSNLSGQNPFQPTSIASIATNFWGWLKADLSAVPGNRPGFLLSSRAQAYVAYKQKYTNWWDRIEFALYGLAGGFDVGLVESSDFNSSTISNNVNNYLSATNFVSGITAVFNDVTNSVDTLASAFKDFTDSFHFQSQGEFSQSFELCPSFEFGNLKFDGITFDMYEVRDICSIIRSSCRLVWTALFSFLGLFLGIRFFVELGKAIAHIFVMLKTLL